MQKEYQILNSAFLVSAVRDTNPFVYIDSFLDTYQNNHVPKLPITNQYEIEVTLEDEVSHHTGFKKIKIHTSKHNYWNFWGQKSGNNNPFTVNWPSRSVQIVADLPAHRVKIISNTQNSALTGEQVFHVMRSIALYSRHPDSGMFLHCSIAKLNGNGVMFIGSSEAGKTTLLLELMTRYNALPVTNDRAIIDLNGRCYSWPSYVSLTEGTIMNFSPLLQQSEKYDAGLLPYKTISWQQPLNYSFSKSNKRIFPHQWLTDALSARYQYSAEIRTVIFPALSADEELPQVKLLSLNESEDYRTLSDLFGKNSFDQREPSFMPWLEIKNPGSSYSVSDILHSLKKQNVTFWMLNCHHSQMSHYINKILFSS